MNTYVLLYFEHKNDVTISARRSIQKFENDCDVIHGISINYNTLAKDWQILSIPRNNLCSESLLMTAAQWCP